MKTVLVLVLAGLLAASAASAGQIYDRNGRYLGSAERHGDATEFYRADGAYSGEAERRGDGYDIFDRDGAYRGRVDDSNGD